MDKVKSFGSSNKPTWDTFQVFLNVFNYTDTDTLKQLLEALDL